MLITNEIIENYFECHYKSYLKRQGLTGRKCNLEKQNLNEIARAKKQYSEKTLQKLSPKHNYTINTTDELPKANKVNVEIQCENFKLTCDLLKKISIDGSDNEFFYVPVLIVPFEKLERKFKVLITALAYVLNKIQRSPIGYGEIIYSSNRKSTKIRIDTYLQEFKKVTQQIEQDHEPQFRLVSHCSMCEFSLRCREKAIKEDHLSLLKGIGSDKIKKLNKKGIFTVHQLSYTFRPKRKAIRNAQRISTRSFELQALSIREKKVFIYDIPEPLPRAKAEMFLDVEALPET